MTRAQFRPDDHASDHFILTTVVGSHPRPEWINTVQASYQADELGEAAYQEALEDGCRAVIADYTAAGLDVITDGEIRRDGMVEHFTPFIDGYAPPSGDDDSDWNAHMPTVEGELETLEPWLVDDFTFAHQLADRPVKVTLPGPFTFSSFCSLDAYDEMETLIDDFTGLVAGEVERLAAAGARWIQLDEPALGMSPHVEIARESIEQIASHVPASVRLGLHVCSGNYDTLAPDIFDFAVDEVDLEFASEDADAIDQVLGEVDLGVDVSVGVVDSQSKDIEDIDTIAANIRNALQYVPADRLTVTPDCGLKPLPRSVAFEKVSNLASAARLVEADLDDDRIELTHAD